MWEVSLAKIIKKYLISDASLPVGILKENNANLPALGATVRSSARV